MSVEVVAVGGYEEVGKNCTAVNVGGDWVVLDLGLDIDKLLQLPDGKVLDDLSVKELISAGVVPDVLVLRSVRNRVKAVVISHAHLDHVGAVPFLASFFPNAVIIGTPFTIGVLRSLSKGKKFNNRIVPLSPGEVFELSSKVSVELVHVTHSTLQSAVVVLHTSEGAVVYANDWKFDNHPVIGGRTDVARLRALGREGVLVLISCALNMDVEGRTYSESVVVDMLSDTLLGEAVEHEGAIIATTFASHIARVKSLVGFAHKLGRTPVILGSSLHKYVGVAEELGLVDFSSSCVFWGGRGLKKSFRSVKDKRDYFFVVTGHQGEKGSVLDKWSRGEFPLVLDSRDEVIFCSKVIPSPINMANRASLVRCLKKFNVRLHKDVHVSGHASKEDQRDLIRMLRPKNFIPAHGTVEILANAISLAYDFDMRLGKEVHLLQNKRSVVLE